MIADGKMDVPLDVSKASRVECLDQVFGIGAEGARLLAPQAPDLILEPRDCRETVVPPSFELTGEQSVVGINGVVFPACVRHSGPSPGQARFAAAARCRLARDRNFTSNIASSANGEIARSTSADTAASMRVLLKALHPFSLDGSI
ncbi:hypothetical protein [Bradyrhizobium algeriense]|uniref:hypothetical protein n=1 Tax=Bradyrhizobium algeriense TaxID=634784 RepID=UPI000D3D7710|nr:hypothetical protein [Bradyrhizobium algeriense]